MMEPKEAKADQNWEKRKESVCKQFNAYCKNRLRWKSYDLQKERTKIAEREVSLYNASEKRNPKLSIVEEYPSDSLHFTVLGYDVSIKNDQLADALIALPDDKREIFLLAYCLNMTDPEIAELLHLVRQTVQYRRAKSLKELRRKMVKSSQ